MAASQFPGSSEGRRLTEANHAETEVEIEKDLREMQ